MKTEKTILPAAALVALYKDSLVVPDAMIDAVSAAHKAAELAEKEAFTKMGEAAMASTPTKEKQNLEIPIDTDTPLKYLGEHLKKIIVLVNDSNAVYLNETDLGLLSSILNACKLNLADIALVNIANQSRSLHAILETLPSNLVIAFDISITQLKLKLPAVLYKPIILGETQILMSNSLSSMQGNEQNAKLEKSKLWVALKALFQL